MSSLAFPRKRNRLDDLIGQFDSLRTAAQYTVARSNELRENAVLPTGQARPFVRRVFQIGELGSLLDD